MSGLSSTTSTSGTSWLEVGTGRDCGHGGEGIRRHPVPVLQHCGCSFNRKGAPEVHGAALGRLHGELQHEERAALGCVAHLEAAAMEVDQLAGDVQAQTGAAQLPRRAAVELVEALEDLVPPLRCDAGAAVRHLKLGRAPIGGVTRAPAGWSHRVA